MTNLRVFPTVLQTLIHAQLNLVQTMEPVSVLSVEALDVSALLDGLENAVIFVSCTSLCACTTEQIARTMSEQSYDLLIK